MSSCAQNYARSLANPFTGPENACVPNYPALQSLKQRSWSKGVVSTGTLGIGFVWFDPRVGAVNDLNCVFYTDNTFAGTAFSVPPTVGVGFSKSNSGLVSTQFGPQATLAYRVVSAGVRARWTGTELNRGGQMICLQNPNHASLLGLAPVNLDLVQQTVRLPVKDDQWTNTLFFPLDSDDLNFRKTFPNTATAADSDSYYIGIMFVAPSGGTGGTFEWEVYFNHELTGYNVRGQTPSHNDPSGFAAVNAVTNFTNHLLPSNVPSARKAEEFLGAAATYLEQGLSWGVQNAPRVLASTANLITNGGALANLIL